MKNIVFFGDSLTSGYGLSSPPTESFPSLLAEIALAAGKPFHFTNAGVSGDTTSSALIRLDKLLQQRQVAIFVIALGANDMIRGYEPGLIVQNLEKIISKIQIAHPHSKILFLGMELPHWITTQRAAAYRNLYSNIAKKYNLVFLPFLLDGVMGSRTLNLSDLVHPNAAGYKVVASRVWLKLEKLL